MPDPHTNQTFDLNGHLILVVDDYPVNRKIVHTILSKAGCRIDEAEDGESALEIVQKESYSAILMDVNMAGMDGLEATRRIRSLGDGKSSVPVIAITATSSDKDLEKCQKAGMIDFIDKPFSRKELLEKVYEAVSEKPIETELDDLYSSEKLSNLRELTGGDTDMMIEMMNVFINHTPQLLKEIHSTFDEGSYEEMSKLAHTLKPTFNYMNRQLGFSLSLSLEREGRRKKPDAGRISTLLDQLDEEAAKSIEAVEELKSHFIS